MELSKQVKDTFIPGKKFLVRSDLKDGDWLNGVRVVESMTKLAGQYVTVSRIITGGNTCAIRIREDCGWWSWSDEMFIDPYGEEALSDTDICIDHLMEVLSV